MTAQAAQADQGTAQRRSAYERFQRLAELPMLVLALLFVPVLLAPRVLDLTEGQASALEAATWLIWAAFVFEYLVLLYLAEDKLRMVRTHVFDLVIIVVPFLRPLRALRVLRVLAALGRAGVAWRRVTTRPGFRVFMVGAFALVAAGAVLTLAFERGAEGAEVATVADALWWAIVTATTVGYGDYTPVTSEGRAVAVVLMLVGIGIFSVVTANIAAFFVEESDEEEARLKEQLGRLEAKVDQLLAGGRR